jgi:hypothetical protein
MVVEKTHMKFEDLKLGALYRAYNSNEPQNYTIIKVKFKGSWYTQIDHIAVPKHNFPDANPIGYITDVITLTPESFENPEFSIKEIDRAELLLCLNDWITPEFLRILKGKENVPVENH